MRNAFVTSQGSPQGRFQRALGRGQIEQAELAAVELPQPLSLRNALAHRLIAAECGDLLPQENLHAVLAASSGWLSGRADPPKSLR